MERNCFGVTPSSFQVVFPALLNAAPEVDFFQNVVNCMVLDSAGAHTAGLANR